MIHKKNIESLILIFVDSLLVLVLSSSLFKNSAPRHQQDEANDYALKQHASALCISYQMHG